MTEAKLLPESLEALLERGEREGCIDFSSIHACADEAGLDEIELENLYAEVEARGIELHEDRSREGTQEGTYEHDRLAVATTDALQLFLNEIGRYPLLTATA